MRILLPSVLVAVVAASPATARAETVTCEDGTTSQSGRGACSHHGGVAKERTRAQKVPQRSEPRARRDEPRTRTSGVQCSDGTRSATTGRGACSHHGGVAGPIAVDHDRDIAPTEPRRRGSVLCNDGTRSRSTGRGTCSGHGGVADEFPDRGQPKARDSRSRVGRPSAVCADGWISYSHHDRGTCSYHGGVARWL